MMMEPETYALASEVYAEVIKAGGYAQIQFMSVAIKYQFLLHVTLKQMGRVLEKVDYGMERADF